MLVLGIIFAVIVFLAFLRLGVTAEYGSDGVLVKARVGLLSIRVFPQKAKAIEAKKIKKIKKIKKKTLPQKPGGLSEFLEMLPAVKNALDRLRRRLLVKDLTIHFVAAGNDAAKTAMTFGAANAAYSVITPVLDNVFRIKRRNLSASADFNAAEQQVYVKAAISIAVWETIYIFCALVPVLVKKATVRKDGHSDGKTSDKRVNGNDNAESKGDDRR